MNRRFNLRAVTLTLIAASWISLFAFLSFTTQATLHASSPAWSGTP
ncbi:hypothetical protein [Deinococcus sedimenti]|uniref:Uncharacterized protein n=1 Tax=Deinococcus sedimenti TaxID=1867090 RepID=A0ABQ2S6S1_9DEIO|nr:hypothetical protein [Deinococcus sedimenti]GGS03165.1 hypothetical protein GCM10008960_32240 [Deinococcus sedimenti]